MRVLDLGASGVIVPLVGTAEEAARAAAACRYPPGGSRSWGPVRTAPTLGVEPAERSEAVLCVVMIETEEGVRNLDEICIVPGVDAVYVGPRDLALTHGLSAGPDLDALIAGIAETCRQHGIPAGIHTRSGASARSYVEAGFLFAAITSDKELLAGAARQELLAALGREPESGEVSADGLLRAATSYQR